MCYYYFSLFFRFNWIFGIKILFLNFRILNLIYSELFSQPLTEETFFAALHTVDLQPTLTLHHCISGVTR